MIKNIIGCLLLIISYTAFGQEALSPEESGEERIISFHADIVIETDGRVEVTEFITVYANNDAINRGIVRRIPIYRKDENGQKQKINVTILSVFRDKQKEKYEEKISGENRVVYIGNKDFMLSPGVYEYVITYESYGHIGFFNDFDEIYWNVTGNEWDFTIEKASATVTLPDGVSHINISCYTGRFGSDNSDCTFEERDGSITFTSDDILSQNEGLTIAVSFPRDIVKRPPPPGIIAVLWHKYKHVISTVLCLLLVGFFFYITWRKVGKDPAKPVVVPSFNPPHGWSPADMRYLYKREFDQKIFTASLISMAVKRAIRIRYVKKQYTLEVNEGKDKLNNEEKLIYNALFKRNSILKVTDSNYTQFDKAQTVLINALETKWTIKDFYLRNIKYAVYGTLITIVAIILYFFLIGNQNFLVGSVILAPFVTFGICAVIAAIKLSHLSVFLRIVYMIFGLVFLFLPYKVASQAFFMTQGDSIFILILILMLIIYMYLIPATTELGAKTISELEGFKLYLKIAEEHRLNLLTPPQRTPELFEKLLPYAIALDVENEWGKKFAQVFQQINYTPDWYSSHNAFIYSGFVSTFSSSFGSSVRNAGRDPDASSSSSSSSSGGSWSSGSSGGGSSGGGGGGGGW